MKTLTISIVLLMVALLLLARILCAMDGDGKR